MELSPAVLRPALFLALAAALPFACAKGNDTSPTEAATEATAATSSGAGGSTATTGAASASSGAGGGCPMGFGDCDGKPDNGCETDLSKSLADCGACGKVCGGPNTTGTCDKGSCTQTCNAGFADCNKSSTDGCEIDTSTNVANCGACGSACPEKGGTPNCVKSQCGVSACEPGLGDCDGIPGNGCETSLSNNPAACGGCGMTCMTPQATTTCKGMQCAIVTCTAGYGDCDDNYSNGCEAELDTLSNCGACGGPCKLPNSNVTCASGTCAVSSCLEPFENCDKNDANGCEADTNSDPANCGVCGQICNLSKPNASPACAAGSCTFACNIGFGNCNNNSGDGCEIDLLNDSSHCGSCGVVCSGGKTCIAGVCGVVGACSPDSYEPNDVQQAPTPPPLLPTMKPLDPVDDSWPLSANRSSSFAAGFTDGSDVDVFYAKVIDDLNNTKDANFTITLSAIPAGATYSVDAFFHCDNGTIKTVYNAVPAACAIGAQNDGFVGSWWHCQDDAPAPSLTYSYGMGCSTTDTSGILQIVVTTLIAPPAPMCAPYSLTLGVNPI